MHPPPSPLIPVRVLQAILVLGGLWFLLPIVLPCLLPFLLALLCAALLEGPVAFLTRRGRLPRFLAAALCTLVFFLLLAGGLGLLVWRLGTECAVLLQKTPQLLSAFTGWLGGVRRWAERFLIAAPIPLQETLRGGMEALEDQGMRLLGDASGLLGTWLAHGASALPQWGLFLFTTALATCLISADRSRLHAFFWRQVPARFRTRLRHMVGAVRDAMTGWLRAQGCLMLVTLCLLTVGFLLLGVDLAILAAGFTALLDALPVFGVGIVLLPWALLSLLRGQTSLALGLLLLYSVLFLTRSILEPKLVGKGSGLPPLAALLAMYTGFILWGAAGMIFLPMAAVMLKELHDRGLVHLWK